LGCHSCAPIAGRQIKAIVAKCNKNSSASPEAEPEIASGVMSNIQYALPAKDDLDLSQPAEPFPT
jgi:hypothetical protein